jgi:hypothetical protein
MTGYVQVQYDKKLVIQEVGNLGNASQPQAWHRVKRGVDFIEPAGDLVIRKVAVQQGNILQRGNNWMELDYLAQYIPCQIIPDEQIIILDIHMVEKYLLLKLLRRDIGGRLPELDQEVSVPHYLAVAIVTG